MSYKFVLIFLLLILYGCNVNLYHESSSFLLIGVNKEPNRFYERNILLSKPFDNVVKLIYDLGKPTVFIVTYLREVFLDEKGVRILVTRSDFIRFSNWINQIKRKKNKKSNQDEFMKKFMDPYRKNPSDPNKKLKGEGLFLGY
jgi:hypothetical protein